MAVMYSKLGGCLGVTTKLGPLARTDLWVGVKGLLDRLITHLGLGSSFEEPWLALLGGVEVGLPSREVAQASWEGCVGCGLWGCLLPCLPALGRLLPCHAWGDLEDWGELDIGGGVVWEELFSSLAGVKTVCWEELSSSEGRCTAPGRELLPSLGGRWAIARVFLGHILGFLIQYKCLVSRFPSDLMKSTVVDESLSSFKTNVLFQRIPSFHKLRFHLRIQGCLACWL